MSQLEKYSAYKDSGVEWLGEIPEHWEAKKLKFIIKNKLQYGANESGDDYEVNLPRYIRITDFSNDGKLSEKNKLSLSFEKAKNYLLKNGDILFARSGATVGKTYQFKTSMSNEKYYAFAGYLIKAEANEKIILSDYLYSYTNSNLFEKWKQNIFSKSTIENIGADKYSELFVVLPPLKEQNLIMSYLDKKTTELNQAITQKESLIALLKEQKQISINEAVTKGLDKNVTLKDSGVEWIGEIPEHWEKSKLGTVLKPISIKDRTDLPLLSITRERGVILRDLENKNSNHNFIPDDLSGYKMVQKNQFAMNKMKAWQGSYGISNYTGIVSPAYYIFDLNGIEPSFFHKAIRSIAYVPFFTQASDGVRIGQWDLSKDRMKEIPFYIPPKREQLQIVEYIENQTKKIDKAINLQENYITKLKEYKASLIDSVVTGKVKVSS